MNEIQSNIDTPNPWIISERQWRFLQQMVIDKTMWGYSITDEVDQKFYSFWLECNHDWIHLRMRCNSGQVSTLQILRPGGELRSVSKQMLMIGWQIWYDSKKIQDAE